MSLNKVIIQGRLVADPDMRTTTAGISVANLRVAVERNYRDGDGNREADFFNCTAWRGTSEFVQKYFHKGDLILIDGKLQNSQFTDKDGNNRVVTQIVADSVFFCGTNGSGKSGGNGGGRYQKHEEEHTYNEQSAGAGNFQDIADGSKEDLPF